MADFTGDLPQPSRLSPASSAPGQSGAAIAGTILGGLTSAASTYFTKQGQIATAEGGNKLASGISDVVLDHPSAGPPPLVGQPNADKATAAGAASPTGQKLNSDLGRIAQIGQQGGAMSELEKLTRINTMVQDAINKDPLHADYYRQQAKDVLGVTPTAKIFELQNEASEFNKGLEQQVFQTNAMAATNAGVTILKKDGSGQPDLQAMAAAGAKILQTDKDAAKSLQEAQLASAKAGQRMSHEDQISLETNTAMAGLNPTLETVHDSLLNNLPVLVSKYGNAGRDQTVAQLGVDLNNNQAQTMNYVDKYILQNHISTESAGKIRGEVHAMFDDYRTLFGDPKASLDQISANAKMLADAHTKGLLNFRQTMPVAARVFDVTGPQGMTAWFGPGTTLNPDVSTALQGETQSFLNGKPTMTDAAAAGHSALTGGYDVSTEQRPQWQSDVTSGIVRTVGELSKTPDKLNGKQQSAFGHGLVQIANVALNDKSPANLEGAASVVNNPSTIRTFVAFAKNPDNAGQVPLVALGINSLLFQHVASARRTLMQGQSTTIQLPMTPEQRSSGSLMSNAKAGFGPAKNVTVTPHSVYNPQSGQMEFSMTATGPDDKPYTMSPQQQASAMKDLAPYRNSVLQVNRSLDAMAVVKDYVPDGTAQLKPLEMRGATAMSAGLPVKAGMTIPLPQSHVQQQETHAAAQETKTGSFADKINRPQLEGGGVGADNHRSSAYGFGQFIKSTFLEEAKKHFPDEVKDKSDSEILALRDNQTFANKVTDAYRNDNARSLKAAGFEHPSDTDLYMAHHFGAADAVRIMKAPLHTPLENILSAKVMRANPDLRGKTPLQIYRKYETALGN